MDKIDNIIESWLRAADYTATRKRLNALGIPKEHIDDLFQVANNCYAKYQRDLQTQIHQKQAELYKYIKEQKQ